MYKLELQWKEYNVDVDSVDAKMRQDYPDFTGSQSALCLELWFSQEPSQEDKDAIVAYWEGISDSSPEAENYRGRDSIAAAKKAAKEAAVLKMWNDMSMIERKLVSGLEVSKAELIEAELL